MITDDNSKARSSFCDRIRDSMSLQLLTSSGNAVIRLSDTSRHLTSRIRDQAGLISPRSCHPARDSSPWLITLGVKSSGLLIAQVFMWPSTITSVLQKLTGSCLLHACLQAWQVAQLACKLQQPEAEPVRMPWSLVPEMTSQGCFA